MSAATGVRLPDVAAVEQKREETAKKDLRRSVELNGGLCGAQAARAAAEPKSCARGGGGAAGEEALQLQKLALPQAVLRVLRVRALLRRLQLCQLLQQQGERASPPSRRRGHP